MLANPLRASLAPVLISEELGKRQGTSDVDPVRLERAGVRPGAPLEIGQSCCSCSCLQQLLCWLICSCPPPPAAPHLSFFVSVSAHHWQLKALGTVPLVVPEKCQSFWRGRGLHRRCRKAQMALMDEQNPTEGPGQRHAGAPSK